MIEPRYSRILKVTEVWIYMLSNAKFTVTLILGSRWHEMSPHNLKWVSLSKSNRKHYLFTSSLQAETVTVYHFSKFYVFYKCVHCLFNRIIYRRAKTWYSIFLGLKSGRASYAIFLWFLHIAMVSKLYKFLHQNMNFMMPEELIIQKCMLATYLRTTVMSIVVPQAHDRVLRPAWH